MTINQRRTLPGPLDDGLKAPTYTAGQDPTDRRSTDYVAPVDVKSDQASPETVSERRSIVDAWNSAKRAAGEITDSGATGASIA
jgi:hypothetical protein